MYHVILNDYQKNTQSVLFKCSDYFTSCEFAKNFSEDFVLSNEGAKYNYNKYISAKRRAKNLPNGYSISKSAGYFPKYTISFKEPNGYLYYGELKKIFTVFIVKIPIVHLPRDKSKMDVHVKAQYNECVRELKMNIIPEEN